MDYVDFLFYICLFLLFLLLLFQRVFIRINYGKALSVQIEYFPLEISLYNFTKNPHKKFRFKYIKKYYRISAALAKTLGFAFKRSTVKIEPLNFDFIISIRFFNIIFSFFVFTFSLLKKKGWYRKLVG